VARARRPSRPNGRALEERFDPFTGPVVVVIRGKGEADTTPFARGGAAPRQGVFGVIWHAGPV
jgi:hypothetical protein